ncbi:MAG: hypothetical protein JNM56_32635 [Planctomycetia bacterium]|nr:hypothetical protein [Planctomycetia bacterium]
MVGRITSFGLLLLGVCVAHVRADDASSSALVQRIYPVADLIGGHDNYYLVPPSSSAVPALPERRSAERATSENELIKLIIHAIAPASWQARGGPGTIDYFPLGMAFVVEQTPEIHERVAELLNGLRDLKHLEVVIETRLLSLSDESFERICSQLGIEPQEADLDRIAPEAAAPVATRAVLDDCQLSQLMETIQEDQRSEVSLAPKLTVFDGQTASLQVVDYQYFVTNVQIVEHHGSVVFVPEQRAVPVGVQIQVKPVVSADIRSVRLDLKMHCTDVAATVPLPPVGCYVPQLLPDRMDGELVPITQFVQQPRVRRWNLEESVQLPDKQTILLAGWKRTRQVASELGGMLADLLGTNFDGLRHREETEHLLLLVTPRIVVSTEFCTQGTGLELPHSQAVVTHPRFPDLFGERIGIVLAGSRLPYICDMYELWDNHERACKDGQCLTAFQLYHEMAGLDPDLLGKIAFMQSLGYRRYP